jgi:hypothetical protein
MGQHRTIARITGVKRELFSYPIPGAGKNFDHFHLPDRVICLFTPRADSSANHPDRERDTPDLPYSSSMMIDD